MFENVDHSQSLPWPKIPSGKRTSVKDLIPILKANIAAKPARDAAARARRDAKIAPPAVQATKPLPFAK